MKRILLVSPFPPYIGGVSVSVQRLYECLNHSGFEAVKFNTQIGNKKYNIKALKFIRYLLLPLYIIGQKRFDVIHFHVSNIIPKFYVSLWRPFFPKRITFIITIHGQVNHILKSKLGYYALRGFDRIILVKRGDLKHIPGPLRSRATEIPAFIPPAVPEGKIQNLPSGLKEFLERDSFKMLLNGFIIFNDRYQDLYGFRDAIVLLEQLRDIGKDVCLILIVMGSKNDRVEREYLVDLKKSIKDNNLENSVFWIENADMELWPVLTKVDVLLRPTKSDGDALSIRESLFLKIPVIASNAVPRPAGTVVYKLKSREDLLHKALLLMDHYEEYVACITHSNISFAHKIIAQYEAN